MTPITATRIIGVRREAAVEGREAQWWDGREWRMETDKGGGGNRHRTGKGVTESTGGSPGKGGRVVVGGGRRESGGPSPTGLSDTRPACVAMANGHGNWSASEAGPPGTAGTVACTFRTTGGAVIVTMGITDGHERGARGSGMEVGMGLVTTEILIGLAAVAGTLS